MLFSFKYCIFFNWTFNLKTVIWETSLFTTGHFCLTLLKSLSLPTSGYFTWQWVGSNFQSPYKWVMSTMPHPQQPCSAPGESCMWLLSCNQSILCLVGLPLFLLSSISPPELLSFPKKSAISCCAQSRTASVLSFFLPPAIFQA